MARVETLGSFDEDKRKLKLDQLAAQDDQRQLEKAQRRQDQETSNAQPEESVQAFLKSWQQDRDAVAQDMAAFEQLEVARKASARQEVKERADRIIKQLFELERSVSAAAYFLPAFEIRNLSATACQLRADMQKLQRAKLPRMPFEFTDPNTIVLVTDPLLQGLKRRGEAHAQHAPDTHHESMPAAVQHSAHTHITGKHNERVVKAAEQLKGQDWKLSDLQDCVVLLHGPMQALYLENLQRCHIQGGPVGGATFGEQLQDCTLMLATHQLRLHHVSGTDVYARPGSDPIIERCEGMRFAPLSDLPYEGFAAAMQAAALPTNASKCAWEQVQDFQWPGHMDSPNWSVIPIAARSDVKQ